MHVMTEELSIRETLRYFGRGLLTDGYSWHDWYVLVVAPHASLRDLRRGKIAASVRSQLHTHDGIVLEPECGPSCAIFHAPNGFDRESFEDTLRQNLSVTISDLAIDIFSVNTEPEEILVLLSRYLNACARTHVVVDPPLSDFDALNPLWDRVKSARATRHQPHIMIVDDDALTRAIISRTLKQDYALVTAANTAEAMRKHMLFAPNIIFLDIHLPGDDGFTFLCHVRQLDPQCKIIMFSGNDYFDNRLTAFAHGACGFISKPFRRSVFEHYIDAWRMTTTRNTHGNQGGTR